MRREWWQRGRSRESYRRGKPLVGIIRRIGSLRSLLFARTGFCSYIPEPGPKLEIRVSVRVTLNLDDLVVATITFSLRHPTVCISSVLRQSCSRAKSDRVPSVLRNASCRFPFQDYVATRSRRGVLVKVCRRVA